MTSEVLNLEPNVPQTVSLKYPSGKPCKNGRMFYTCTDGRSLFLPAYVEEKLKALHIRPHQPFSLTLKAAEGQPSDYEIQPVKEPEVKMEGILPRNAAHLATVAPHSPQLFTGQSQFILQQLTAALDVVRVAEAHAAHMGRPVTFTSEDIRALAISCFISQSREGVAR